MRALSTRHISRARGRCQLRGFDIYSLEWISGHFWFDRGGSAGYKLVLRYKRFAFRSGAPIPRNAPTESPAGTLCRRQAAAGVGPKEGPVVTPAAGAALAAYSVSSAAGCLAAFASSTRPERQVSQKVV